jgi:hypothetical protein
MDMPRPNALFHKIAAELIERGENSLLQFADCPPEYDPEDNRTDFTLKVLRAGYCIGYCKFRIAVCRQDQVNTISNIKIMSRNFNLVQEIKSEDNYDDDTESVVDWYCDKVMIATRNLS